jgi:hypothetical protein
MRGMRISHHLRLPVSLRHWGAHACHDRPRDKLHAWHKLTILHKLAAIGMMAARELASTPNVTLTSTIVEKYCQNSSNGSSKTPYRCTLYTAKILMAHRSHWECMWVQGCVTNTKCSTALTIAATSSALSKFAVAVNLRRHNERITSKHQNIYSEVAVTPTLSTLPGYLDFNLLSQMSCTKALSTTG